MNLKKRIYCVYALVGGYFKTQKHDNFNQKNDTITVGSNFTIKL